MLEADMRHARFLLCLSKAGARVRSRRTYPETDHDLPPHREIAAQELEPPLRRKEDSTMIRSARNPLAGVPRAIRQLALVLALFVPAGRTLAASPNTALLTEFRRDPMSFFFAMRTTELLQCGQAVLEKKVEFTPAETQNALTALAATYVASGKEMPARAAIQQILATDSRAELNRPEELPPPLVDLFYGVRDSLALASNDPGTPQILTLAIGDIENNSIVKGKYNLDLFARGLTHILTTDLRDASPFKLVDRQRLAALRSEIEMSRDDQITDPRYAVPLGRLCGAQSFLFGSIMQTDKNRVRLDIRWVDTSTSEILLSEGVEGKLSSSNDLFALERKLLLDVLAPKMEAWLQGQGKRDRKSVV
jgi:TolB-like protein